MCMCVYIYIYLFNANYYKVIPKRNYLGAYG